LVLNWVGNSVLVVCVPVAGSKVHLHVYDLLGFDQRFFPACWHLCAADVILIDIANSGDKFHFPIGSLGQIGSS
jgi:hypothetical protein